jgi:hypothetical protein
MKSLGLVRHQVVMAPVDKAASRNVQHRLDPPSHVQKVHVGGDPTRRICAVFAISHM